METTTTTTATRYPGAHKDDPALPVEERLEPLKTKVEACVVKLLHEFEQRENSPGWKKVKDKRAITVHLHHQEENPIKAAKARGLVPGSPDLLLRILQSLDYYHEIDPMYTGGRVVETFPDHQHEILYAMYSSGFNFIVSPRDFVYLEGRRRFDDDKRVIACFSIERDDVPPERGYVRGHIFETGWVISPYEPSQEEIEKAGLSGVETNCWCDAMFYAQVDFKGWIPTWLVNRLSGELGKALQQLRKFIQEKGHTIVLHADSDTDEQDAS